MRIGGIVLRVKKHMEHLRCARTPGIVPFVTIRMPWGNRVPAVNFTAKRKISGLSARKTADTIGIAIPVTPIMRRILFAPQPTAGTVRTQSVGRRTVSAVHARTAGTAFTA